MNNILLNFTTVIGGGKKQINIIQLAGFQRERR